ncbi:MAG: hypothetical protein ACOYL7_14650, partial [Caldilinea sp.]
RQTSFGLSQCSLRIAARCQPGSALVKKARRLVRADQFAQIGATQLTTVGIWADFNSMTTLKARNCKHTGTLGSFV